MQHATIECVFFNLVNVKKNNGQIDEKFKSQFGWLFKLV